MKKLLVLGLLALAAIGVGLYFVQGWNGAGPAQRPVAIVIEPGSSLAAAARTLEEAGAIRSADRFLFQARIFGGSTPIKSGEYEIPARASHSTVLGLLQSGKTLQRMVVVRL